MTLGSLDKQVKLEQQPGEKLQIEKNTGFLQSFGHAVEGIGQLLKRERNMRFHFFASAVVIYIGFMLKINRQDWLWIAMAIFAVIMAEFVNTMIETMVDLVVGQLYHPLAKVAKDVAAGAVVFAAVYAIAVGTIVFWPYLVPRISQMLQYQFLK
ncbi:diacylglycerol kinase family protein [Weissella kandleri]|uniref:diacylglycerol kinase family protein n=1 Tax=Weissella kandleri TaxID=1616 RepID=UPI00387EDDA0